MANESLPEFIGGEYLRYEVISTPMPGQYRREYKLTRLPGQYKLCPRCHKYSRVKKFAPDGLCTKRCHDEALYMARREEAIQKQKSEQQNLVNGNKDTAILWLNQKKWLLERRQTTRGTVVNEVESMLEAFGGRMNEAAQCGGWTETKINEFCMLLGRLLKVNGCHSSDLYYTPQDAWFGDKLCDAIDYEVRKWEECE